MSAGFNAFDEILGIIGRDLCKDKCMRMLRNRRLGRHYDLFATLIAVVLSVIAVLAVSIWALGQTP